MASLLQAGLLLSRDSRTVEEAAVGPGGPGRAGRSLWPVCGHARPEDTENFFPPRGLLPPLPIFCSGASLSAPCCGDSPCSALGDSRGAASLSRAQGVGSCGGDSEAGGVGDMLRLLLAGALCFKQLLEAGGLGARSSEHSASVPSAPSGPGTASVSSASSASFCPSWPGPSGPGGVSKGMAGLVPEGAVSSSGTWGDKLSASPEALPTSPAASSEGGHALSRDGSSL